MKSKILDAFLNEDRNCLSIRVRVEKETKLFELALSKLSPIPSSDNPIVEVRPDQEIGFQGVIYRLADGNEGTVLLDAFLENAGDPSYFRDLALYEASLLLHQISEGKEINKLALAQSAEISPAHIYRIFNSGNKSKTIDQVVKVLAALGFKLTFSIQPIHKLKVSASSTQVDSKFKDLFVTDQSDLPTTSRFNPLKMQMTRN